MRTLPGNAQRVCLIVPLGTGATVPGNEVHRVYSDAEAKKLFGGTVAAAMTRAAINANPYLDLSIVAATGTTTPDITSALNATAPGNFNILVPAWFDLPALTKLRTHIEHYTDAIEQQSLLGIAATTSTLSAATTLTTGLNNGAVSLALLPGSPSSEAEIAAAYAAVIAGEADPARPLNGLALTGILPPPLAKRLTRTEQEAALANGITPLEVGPGDAVQIVRAISTYTKNATGADDIALLDLTTMRTLYYVRQACRERIRLRFPREKLSARTPAKVRSELLDVLKKLEELEIVENVDDNADGLIVQRSTQDPSRLDARIPTDVVNGLHVFAARIDLLL
ncbi:Phage tail sheath protein [compost metagenome]